MKTFIHTLLVATILCFAVVPCRAGTDTGTDLTKQLAAILDEIDNIKPGMTRADLTKTFSEIRGGLQNRDEKPYFQQNESFAYGSCPIISVDVDFKHSDSKYESPTDIIVKISSPYLARHEIR